MLHEFFKSELKAMFEHEPTESQEKAIQQLSEFITSPESNDIFLLEGYAGTGKTHLVASLIKVLKKFEQKSVLLAPTGRAAKVLSHFSGEPAFTIHKKIYRQKSMSVVAGQFNLDRNLHRDTLFIVDEASMIANQNAEGSVFGTGRLLDDLFQFIYSADSNCKLILIGDTAQLPPVGLDISPALDPDVLRSYYMVVHRARLTEVMRQHAGGILENATRLRDLLPKDSGSKVDLPDFRTTDFDDIFRITGTELLDALEECYSRFGNDETVVLTRSNSRANRFNQGIRNTILYREEEISAGDRLMIVKNNYHWTDPKTGIDFIANGDIAQIQRISGIEEVYGFRFADVTLRFVDYGDIEVEAKINIDTLNSETSALTKEQNEKLFEEVSKSYDFPQKGQRNKAVREDPYFNALQVKFAYAITCHKAQGGQWSAVFIDQGYFVDDMLNRDYIRWMYTALTRATERAYLVNFHKSFFTEVSDSFD